MRGIVQEAQRGPKVRKSLPPVGGNQSLAALPRLPGRQGRAAHTALPGTDFRSIRCVFISAGWYNSSIPQLETGRLVLRAPGMDDWPDYWAMMQTDRSIGMGGPFNQRDAWGMFCHDLGQWRLFGHGALMIDEKVTGRCVGQVGINAGPLFDERELGWFVYDGFEGKGYAFEAAKALRDWAFAERNFPTLASYVDEDNHRSRELAERLGAILDPDAQRDGDDLVYRHSPVNS